ncbi:SIR2 family NAD-dependent protein deacylase [Sulfurospirillum deleyianum]|uniref:Uncharacterized protein n=1 Tax=Sulfurospirillum deleyianum (strain ATCC 51133 / DSM 6946 / 5175) TaxID=525898 RepID=D1AZA4_SULD5|nr:SIR2 family protein [Sulfurospirillum deleyianum]ACZ11371.1 hypothetical protein Sdel_0334 [Sulfurospirillum deleyianum DSM 6946]
MELIEIKEKLAEHLNTKFLTAPYLFIGSGLSKRYLGLENWEELLARYCKIVEKPFRYYKDSSEGDLGKVASNLSSDFFDVWWKSSDYKDSREEYEKIDVKIVDKSLPLKYEIAQYLKTVDIIDTLSKLDDSLKRELELLKKASVDGIITTNYDLLIESIFPDFKPFIGQSEMLFGRSHNIAEIYKIHGCCSKFNSLVLTYEDYEDFNSRNSYLAAKLLTTFVDHPVIFMGYKLGDKNINAIIEEIVKAIGTENVSKLQDRLIFIKRGESIDFARSSHTVNHSIISTITIETNSFIPIFEALGTIKRKVPAKIARLFKEQFYELSVTNNPSEKLCVRDIESLSDSSDVEFAIGIGVATSDKGYRCIDIKELIEDFLNDDLALNVEYVLKYTIPKAKTHGRNKSIPIFKYLNADHIDSEEKYQSKKQYFSTEIIDLVENGFSNATANPAQRKLSLILELDIQWATKLAYIASLKKEEIINDLDELLALLKELNKIIWSADQNAISNFKRLVAIYDRLKFAWDERKR